MSVKKPAQATALVAAASAARADEDFTPHDALRFAAALSLAAVALKRRIPPTTTTQIEHEIVKWAKRANAKKTDLSNTTKRFQKETAIWRRALDD